LAGAFVFPARQFAPSSLRVRPLGQAVSGGVSLSGEENFGDASGGGRWVADFGESALWTPDQVNAWRAFEAFADGGVQPIIVPLAERVNAPLDPAFDGADDFGKDTWVSDVTAWTAYQVSATTTASAALGATSLTFNYTNASANKTLKPGHHFAILHPTWSWRVYRIVRVTAGGVGAGESTTVIFRTPLREAVGIGAALNFDTPRFVARVDGDISAEVQLYKFGKASARFIEFPRAP
jgi:hypothetical protein